MVSPEPGDRCSVLAPDPLQDRCIVGFKDDNERYAYIVSFINDFYNGRTTNMNIANSGIPRFMI